MGLLIWAKFFSFSLTKLHPHYKSQLKSGDMGKEAYTLYKDCPLSKIPFGGRERCVGFQRIISKEAYTVHKIFPFLRTFFSPRFQKETV